MKLLFFCVGRKKKDNATGFNRADIERMLLLAFIITFTVMLLVQAALVSPAVRSALAVDDELEGKPLGMEEYLYKEGLLLLEITGAESSPRLKVLVNGDEAGAFVEKTVEILVKEGDVVEIDASELEDEAVIAVISKTDNISEDCITKRIKVNSNVKRLLRVKMK